MHRRDGDLFLAVRDVQRADALLDVLLRIPHAAVGADHARIDPEVAHAPHEGVGRRLPYKGGQRAAIGGGPKLLTRLAPRPARRTFGGGWEELQPGSRNPPPP